MCDSCQMIDCDQTLRFILAGNAYFTLRSRKTSTRYTFRVSESKDGKAHFVSCLYGTSNTDDYAYVGLIRDAEFRLTAKSRFTVESPQAKAFNYLWHHLMNADRLPEQLEFWHEGRCGRCGRVLTVPESIASGIGPECAKIMGRESSLKGSGSSHDLLAHAG